ncbi:AAA family ATPase [Micromonospora inaquosa]|uniref:Clp protease n=1 Tax=Micromonospora inaquosa TaxID=2203716 RepID=A0A3N9WLW4_9ACTN|nr:AAA family ATPase [Micromonospora inaquosa]RQX01851.1 Clp protease [Micromonospora inaquosa]
MTAPVYRHELPAWAREIELSLPLHPQVLLSGNVRDLYPVVTLGPEAEPDDETVDLVDLSEMVWKVVSRRGYAAMLLLNPVTAKVDVRADDQAPEWIAPLRRSNYDTPGAIGDLLVQVVQNRDAPVALVLPYTARLAPVDGLLDPGDRALLTRAEVLGHQAAPTRGHAPRTAMAPFNTVVWVCERQEELHPLFPIGSPMLRVVPVPRPTLDVRATAARILFAGMAPDDRRSRAYAMAEVTHDMTVRDVIACGRLARDRGLPADRYADAARLLQVGITDDPWSAERLRQKISTAEEYLNQRVVGQERAVRKAVDILIRSAVGLNGAHASSSPNRPRGVLFLAGPTGVGKTELAKAIASLVLGEDAKPHRFDMSEFRADEAHQRLIGAPPGYVGYAAGGELTNAVRANPVSVLLFDEIDKAHPRIFDLFLQILEDGRLTDGRGATVYFTECFLVFTSNLGVSEPKNPDGESAPAAAGPPAVSYHTQPAQVERLLRDAFTQFFNQTLGRPELRNRFGDSYVVLDYIRPHVAPVILAKALRSVAARVARTHDLRLDIRPDVEAKLSDIMLERLADGGRAIGTLVETVVVNPLGRWIFDKTPAPGSVITLTSIAGSDGDWRVEVS